MNLQRHLVYHIQWQTITRVGCDDGTFVVAFPLRTAHAGNIMLSVFPSIIRFQGDVRTPFYYLKELIKSRGVPDVHLTNDFDIVFSGAMSQILIGPINLGV